MAINKQQFQEIQKRAKEIIDRDRRGELDQYVKGMKANRLDEGDIAFETPERMTQTSQGQYPQMTPQRAASSKLPREIVESFSNNPIDIPEYSGSILDDMGIEPPVQKKQPIRETKQVVQSTASGVDYSLIKTIVEDCLRKSMSTLKKSMLTENTSGTNQLSLMRIGESFKLVASNGDIFEAKLIKKGNVNERKKA